LINFDNFVCKINVFNPKKELVMKKKQAVFSWFKKAADAVSFWAHIVWAIICFFPAAFKWLAKSCYTKISSVVGIKNLPVVVVLLAAAAVFVCGYFAYTKHSHFADKYFLVSLALFFVVVFLAMCKIAVKSIKDLFTGFIGLKRRIGVKVMAVLAVNLFAAAICATGMEGTKYAVSGEIYFCVSALVLSLAAIMAMDNIQKIRKHPGVRP
jgi:hypothetical protein